MNTNLERLILSVCVLIILIVILYIFDKRQDDFETYFGGMWKCDELFCKEAGMTESLLYIGDEIKEGISLTKKYKSRRNAHLVMNDNITNQPIVIYYNRETVGLPTNIQKYKISGNIEFSAEKIMPDELIFEVDIIAGTLKILSADTIYGFYHKDNVITNNMKLLNEQDDPMK